jgi:predicted transcriptional regulator
MKNEPIATVMQTRVRTSDMDDSVYDAETFLNSEGLSWAPVVGTNSEPVGVLSADDLMRFHANKRDALNTPTWQLCTYRPIGVSPDTTISSVARLTVERKIHHVAINENGELKGVGSSKDLLRMLI